jgi:electron transfer DM13
VRKLLLAGSHLLAVAIGFVLGVYMLPILLAPAAPSAADVAAHADQASFKSEFRRDLKGSDVLHWGEGVVFITPASIALAGELAPGPDYKLYLSPEFVETAADFKRLKASMVRIGDVKTFRNFVVSVPGTVDPARYNTVIVWCETFSKFITSARYR